MEKEAIYNKIDKAILQRAATYVYNSKIAKKEETDSMRKLLEESLDNYMNSNPIHKSA